MRRKRRRRYLLNTNVPLAAYYGSPGAREWLKRHGGEAYYSDILELELRGHPAKTEVLNLLRAYHVAKLSTDKGRLRREAVRLLKKKGLSLRYTNDMMHVLLAKERKLVIVSYDEDIERLAEILRVPYKRPWGKPYGPQDVHGSSNRASSKRGKEDKGQNRSSHRTRGRGERKRKRKRRR